MNWLSRIEAMKLEEGCAVLVRRPVKPPRCGRHFIYDLNEWFIPDHITDNRWGRGDEEYLLIEPPIKRKKK